MQDEMEDQDSEERSWTSGFDFDDLSNSKEPTLRIVFIMNYDK